MRILILGNIPPHRIGGAEVQARLLARQFARSGHQVTVAGYDIPQTRIIKEIGRDGAYATVRLPVLRYNRYTRSITYGASLSRFLLQRKSDFDVVLSFLLGESELVAALLKQVRLLPLPLVACTGSFGLTGDAARLKRLPFTSKINALLVRHCDRINIITPSIEKELVDLGFCPSRFSHIPNGVPLNSDDINAERFKKSRRTFLFTGRFVPIKGLGDLLRAIHLLKARGLMVTVNLVGAGQQDGEMRSLAQKLDIVEQVTFHGKTPPDEMGRHYRDNTVLVLPSRQEAQGMVVAEAMSFGLPVIVTRCGGPEYTVDEGMARICPKKDPAALAAAMEEMLNMPEAELKAMGARARRHVGEYYDIEKVAERYLDLFSQLTAHQAR